MNSPENKLVFAGLDLGASDLKYGLVDSSGDVLISKKTKTDKGRQAIAAQMHMAASELFTVANQKGWRVGRIGAGSPGVVNFASGEIIGNSPNIPGWVGANLKKTLAGLGVLVYADNDANCAAWAEYLFGAARDSVSALCITVGTGIGGGLMLDGKIYRGASFSAGEIGHATIVFDGEKCACGNRGCLEKYASVTALMNSARQHLANNKKTKLKNFLESGKLTVEALVNAALEKEKSAIKLIQRQATYLAAGLASTVNFINPERLVIGGGFLDAYPPFVQMVEKEIRKRAFPAALQGLKIARAELGNKAGMVGAAFLEEKV